MPKKRLDLKIADFPVINDKLAEWVNKSNIVKLLHWDNEVKEALSESENILSYVTKKNISELLKADIKGVNDILLGSKKFLDYLSEKNIVPIIKLNLEGVISEVVNSGKLEECVTKLNSNELLSLNNSQLTAAIIHSEKFSDFLSEENVEKLIKLNDPELTQAIVNYPKISDCITRENVRELLKLNNPNLTEVIISSGKLDDYIHKGNIIYYLFDLGNEVLTDRLIHSTKLYCDYIDRGNITSFLQRNNQELTDAIISHEKFSEWVTRGNLDGLLQLGNPELTATIYHLPQLPEFVNYRPWASFASDALLRNFNDILLKKLVSCSAVNDLCELFIDLIRFIPETRERFLRSFDEGTAGDTIKELKEVSSDNVVESLSYHYPEFLCSDVQVEILSFLDVWDIGCILLAVAHHNHI